MQNGRIKNIIILLLKLVAIEESLSFIAANYFFEIKPSAITPAFVISILALIVLNWKTNKFQNKSYLKPTGIILVFISLFFAVHFRAGIVWAQNTFPLNDANMVLLTLEEPFDDFAYSMVELYLKTTIPQALLITTIVTIFLYATFSHSKIRYLSISLYLIATIGFLFNDIPISDYIHILKGEPEKNATYSKVYKEHYANPDSIKISPPEKKRNLILIYLESLETTFADKLHGGNQEENLIPEITKLAIQNINFGRTEQHIGGGFDTKGSNCTFCAIYSRSLGIPYVVNYKKIPQLHNYKSLYKILNEYGYKQIFFQGNPGLFKEFQKFVTDQNVDEVFGPEDLITFLNLDTLDMIRKQGFKTVQDKEAFKFANQILDTIHEPFSLTFFTIDTHAPFGLYDHDCEEIPDRENKDDRLKASARCVSKELDKFLNSIKSKAFYENTTIIVFGDHLFMGTRLIKDFPNRKWIDIFINTPKIPFSEKNRLFSDIDMFPTILSSLNFNIENEKLGLGTNLFSNQKSLVECIGLDSLNKEINKMPGHLMYETYLQQKMLKSH